MATSARKCKEGHLEAPEESYHGEDEVGAIAQGSMSESGGLPQTRRRKRMRRKNCKWSPLGLCLECAGLKPRVPSPVQATGILKKESAKGRVGSPSPSDLHISRRLLEYEVITTLSPRLR